MDILAWMKSINKKITQAGVLQFAAVVVAAPRYMGMFPYSMGTLITEKSTWFMAVESYSGLAMAVLEGWAIAYTSGRLRAIKSPRHKRIVQNLIILQLAMLPLTLAPFMMGAELGQLSTKLLPLMVAWVWKFAVAAISPIIVFTVGYVDVPQTRKGNTPVAKNTLPAEDTPPAEDNLPDKGKPRKKRRQTRGSIWARRARVDRLEREGKTNAQIAELCGVSVGTIKNDKRANRNARQ